MSSSRGNTSRLQGKAGMRQPGAGVAETASHQRITVETEGGDAGVALLGEREQRAGPGADLLLECVAPGGGEAVDQLADPGDAEGEVPALVVGDPLDQPGAHYREG